MKTIAPNRLCLVLISIILSAIPTGILLSQNLIINGSMTSNEGVDVVAPGWQKSTPSLINSPDVNDAVGNVNTTVGYTWYGGIPLPSPDGGTWQNVFSGEGFSQTVNGLTIGTTYYFRYYYTSQGIQGYGSYYNIPSPPYVTIKGATGYSNPSNAGTLFVWNTYCSAIVATATSITITDSATHPSKDYYLAYDGFYLSATPFSIPQITQQPVDVTFCNFGNADFTIQATNATNIKWQANSGAGWADINDNSVYSGTSTNHLHITNAGTAMNNYSFRCGVTNNACAEFSLPATLTVTAPAVPSLTITPSTQWICKGSAVSFTAVLQHEGTSPILQWKKNGVPVGSNSNSYTDYNPLGTDVFTCLLTSNEACISSAQVVSNSVSINLFTNPVVALNKFSGICSGDTKLLDAGNFKFYEWNNGSTSRTLPVNDTGTYFVTVTDINGCKGSDTSRISIKFPKPGNFLPNDTSICKRYGSVLVTPKTSYTNLVWNDASTGSSLNITAPGLYWLDVTDLNNCRGRDSIKIYDKECLYGFYISNAFTPNGDSKNDIFRPFIYGNLLQYEFIVFNRYGQVIFKTTNQYNGWDGTYQTKNLDKGTFVWICKYQLAGEQIEFKRGNVVLIR